MCGDEVRLHNLIESASQQPIKSALRSCRAPAASGLLNKAFIGCLKYIGDAEACFKGQSLSSFRLRPLQKEAFNLSDCLTLARLS